MVENLTYALSQSCSQIVYSAPDRVRLLLSSTKSCGLLRKQFFEENAERLWWPHKLRGGITGV